MSFRSKMTMCRFQKRFLFEVMPSIFPGGELGETEMALWELYLSDNDIAKQGGW